LIAYVVVDCLIYKMSSLDSVPVSRIMTSSVKTVAENQTIQQACKTMVENNIGSVIILDQSNAPAGIITERDVVRHLAEKPISFAEPAGQIMSRPLVTIHPNGSLRDALQTMQSRDIRRLVVASNDGKNMTGIVSDKDIFRFISKNESVASAFVSEGVLTRNRGDMEERLSTSVLDDLVHRRL
jgi:CBS domain-containing protein